MLTNSPNGLSSFGVPVMPGLAQPFTGTYYFVNPATGSDSNPGTSADRPFATLYKANAAVTSGKNDVIFLIGDGSTTGTARLSTALAQTIDSSATSGKLTISKNAVHIVGIASESNNSRARVAPPSGTYTVTTFNSAVMVEVSGAGCSISNLSFYNGFSTGGAAQICMKVSAARNVFNNCQFQGLQDAGSAADAGSRSLLVTGGGESVFNNCIIGNDTIDRGAANANLELAGATPRNTFNRCIFPAQTTAATPLFILGTGAGCVDRWNLFDSCLFINNIKSTSTIMTVGISFTNASPGGALVLKNCTAMGMTKWGDTNALANTLIDMPVVSAAAGGLSLAPT